MGIEQMFFYGLSACIIILACLVIFSKNPIHSVLYLILTMIGISGHYLMLNAQFLAIVHIIVYAGAIMVLFLFVLMLINPSKDSEPKKSKAWQFLSILAGSFLLISLLAIFINVHNFATSPDHNPSLGLVKNLGMALFTDYVLPFEISSILFLAAMVGAVLIGSREKNNEKDTIE